MPSPTRISYWFIFGTFVLVGVLHLGTPMLAALFSLLVLQRLHRIRNKWLAISIFVVLVLAGSFVLARFTAKAVVALPAVAEKAIPSIIDYAKVHDVELPFTDWESLKTVTLETAKGQAQVVGKLATSATRELAFLLIGIVVAATMFLRPEIDIDRGKHPVKNNLYSLSCDAIGERFRLFYDSFTMVMGAQIIISAINTGLTAIFVLVMRLDNAALIIGITFLCGLLPVVGNLISNSIIAAIAFTVSPRAALVALAFLVVIHKLEYILNSKIVGDRIRNPVWLTLLGLVLGETLMGIPGMILAPVLLSYLKAETVKIEVPDGATGSAAAASAPAAPAVPG